MKAIRHLLDSGVNMGGQKYHYPRFLYLGCNFSFHGAKFKEHNTIVLDNYKTKTTIIRF